MADEIVKTIEPVVIGFDEARDGVPAVPVEAMTPAELLAEGTVEGLRQTVRIVKQEIDFTDLKQQRLIGDLALGMTRLFVRAAESEFRARHDDVLDKLLAMIEAEKVKKD